MRLIQTELTNQDSSYSYYSRSSDSLSIHDIHSKSWNNYYSTSSLNDSSLNGNSLLQLTCLSLISTFGTMGAIFVISSITVIDIFQVRGNIFLVSLSLSHLIITILVIPASCISVMANLSNESSICHFQWLATLSCLLISFLSFMFMSIDNFYGLHSLNNYDSLCTKFRIVLIVLLIWTFGIAFSIGQHINSFGPSVCPQETSNTIWLPYHASVFGLTFIVPSLIALFYFTRCIFRIQFLKVQLETNRTEDAWSYIVTNDKLLKSNIIVYFSTFLMWTPLCIVSIVHLTHPISQKLLNLAWYLALANSCIFSFLYALTNKEFGNTFFKLFYYCCCKSHVTFTRKGPGPRRAGFGTDQINLRVHIIPGLNMYQRRNSGSTVPTRVVGNTNYTSHSSSSSSYHGPMALGSRPIAKAFNLRGYKTSSDL